MVCISGATISRLKPEQVGAWLGFTLDLREGKFLVPEDKVARLVKSIDGILASSPVHVRWLASAVGSVYSMLCFYETIKTPSQEMEIYGPPMCDVH